MAFVVRALGALQLQVKTVRKDARQMQGAFQRPRAVALHKRLADSTALRTRQGNQPFIELLKPLQLDDGLVPHHALGPGARQQLRQIQIARVALYQQQQTGGRCAGLFAGHLYPDIGAYQRLDTGLAGFLVKLDRPEQVAQVGDGQRRLLVGCGGLNDFINTVGTVYN